MESIKQIYRIGRGPSSSHTMGPRTAAEEFAERTGAQSCRVTLYGSLAATGRGHLTDLAIARALAPVAVEFVWKPEVTMPLHPNAMLLEGFDADGNLLNEELVYSTGGGMIVRGDETPVKNETALIYRMGTMKAILASLEETGKTFWEFVEDHEGSEVWSFLGAVWDAMRNSIRSGLENEGVLPGGLGLARKAASYHIRAGGFKGSLKRRALLFAYALAAAEENAAGGVIVTAPTCGSCGVLPAVLHCMEVNRRFSRTRILRALATAGVIGNLVKKNASISGARVGCQGEIGTACAMAAAAVTQLFGGTPYQIEYSAEMGLEHHLGLTCDPVAGLVQIPCIERNAFAASRALDANTYAMLSDGRHRISFDVIVETMNRTGNDLPSIYRETSMGGLAKAYRGSGS